MTHWYEPLRDIVSLGSQAEKIANMGELHAARLKHLSQFFTPDAVARLMWTVVSSWQIDRKITVLDSSIGSGRLIQFADPERHAIYGVDVHAPTIEAVQQVVEGAGFECELLHAGMEDIHPKRFDVAIINPPFSLHLESPHLQPFSCTAWGRFGRHSSALSHEYALEQALEAAQLVVALLPITFVQKFDKQLKSWDEPFASAARRLVGVFELPANAFREEGAEVRTAIAVFSKYRELRESVVRHVLTLEEATLPEMRLNLDVQTREARLSHQRVSEDSPAITRPVTSQKRVRINHDGRRIVLGFECGLIEALVKNEILDRRIVSLEGQRLPRGFRYAGQARLDIETYLVQEDPHAALESLVQLIEGAGGSPEFADGFLTHFSRRLRRSRRQSVPLSHVVWANSAQRADEVEGIARKTHVTDPTKWGSPVVTAGQRMRFSRVDAGRYLYEVAGTRYELSLDELNGRFAIENASHGWETVHEGLLKAYPNEARALRMRMQELGIDEWLDWEFQQDDLIELLLKPQGAIAAWEQACGKSRLAVALILLSGVKHGLIVVEARLIEEMRTELANMPRVASLVKIVQSPEDVDDLNTVNLISYERLRMPIHPGTSKRVTYAHRLRRRIGLVAADEGERLANPASDQSRALWQLSARRRYVLTGTPVANYPRDVFGLVAFAGGDGTAAQPYGYRRGYLEPWWLSSVQHAVRGIDRFRDDFVVLEWVTWEFAESLQDGAKREVPKIGNLPQYRKMLAPHVKRRIVDEPAVSRYIRIEKPDVEVVETEWDASHLSFYLRTADEFARWYQDQCKVDRGNNLITLLARLRAVHFAANYPQFGVDGIGVHGALTSKQRAVVERLVEIHEEGAQAILFAENPGLIELLRRELEKRGVDAVPFHGGIPIRKRVADKDKRFLNGNATGLLCTKASGRAGYNLPNADYVLFYDRSWTWRIEYQAMRRALRWNRKGRLKLVYFHLPGSIDVYQDQMVAHKRDATEAGLDWATPVLEDEAFMHMDTLLDQFVDDLAVLHGRTHRDQREVLKEAA